MPLAVFKWAYLSSLHRWQGIVAAVEELSFSVLEICQYICSAFQHLRYLNKGDCRICKKQVTVILLQLPVNSQEGP